MAWLNAVPKLDESVRRAQPDAPAPTISRAERMKSEGVVIPMPPNSMPHIIDRLVEIGLSEAVGMGVAPVGWQTIAAWKALSGIDLPSWEARLIRRLSVEYVAEQRRAESPNCLPPWRWQATEAEKKAETSALQRLLG